MNKLKIKHFYHALFIVGGCIFLKQIANNAMVLMAAPWIIWYSIDSAARDK